MALLDQVMGYLVNQSQSAAATQTPASSSQSSAPNLSPIAKSVMLVLAAKAWQAYSSQRASNAGATTPETVQASHGLGGLMAMLGGATALRSLMGRFEQSGFTDQANSWIGHGDNAPLQAEQVETAVGGGTLEELAKRFQIPVEQLKSELASALPQAVDHLTPQGRLPSDADLAKL